MRTRQSLVSFMFQSYAGAAAARRGEAYAQTNVRCFETESCLMAGNGWLDRQQNTSPGVLVHAGTRARLHVKVRRELSLILLA